jgi:hypothetical protein
MIKKVTLKGWRSCYFTGEVTEASVEVLEPETMENIRGSHGSYIDSKVVIRLVPEIRKILGYEGKTNFGMDDTPVGTRVLRAHVSCEKETDRAISSLWTRHATECQKAFAQHHIDEMTRRLISCANHEIKESQEEFVRCVASSLGSVDNWDAKEKLEELATERKRLQTEIAGLEANMKGIMKAEIDEWLTEEEICPVLKESILDGAKFKYLPDVFIIR